MKTISLSLLAAFLAMCGTGCGKNEETAPAKTNITNAAAEDDLDAIVRRGVAAVAQKDATEAAAAAKAALEREPDSAEAHLLAGQAAYLEQNYDQARKEFETVAKTQSLPKSLRSKGYAGLGLIEFVQHEVETARILFLQAQLFDYKNESTWYHLGLIYRDTYQFREAALEQFQMFTRLSRPDDPFVEKVGRELIPELRKAIQRLAAERPGASGRDPGRAAKLYEEAQTLEAKKQIPLAKKKYADALAADPLSYPIALGYARLLNSIDKKPATEVDKALEAYRAAIDQRPSVQKNYMEAARLAFSNKRWATVVQILNRAIAHDPRPKNGESLDVLIGALRKAGKSKLEKSWRAYRTELGK